MKLEKIDGVKLLRTNGAAIMIDGEFDMGIARTLINAELIELAETKNGSIMLIDEGGKLLGKPINIKATNMYKYSLINGALSDVIVGDVIFMPRNVFIKLDKEEESCVSE